jgi:hypothetical protein
MEGRFAKNLVFVLTDCKDPAQDAEFNEWYDNTHLPDVLSSGLLRNPVRFVRAADTPGDQEPRYLATWESDSETPGELLRQLIEMGKGLLDRGRVHPSLRLKYMGMLRYIDGGFWSRSQGHEVAGAMVVSSNCTDPAREDEFNDWYSNIHLPDILSTGAFHTDYRYEDINPQESVGKYWAIYETDIDPVRAAEILDARREWFVANNRRTDTIDPVRRSLYRRIYPPAKSGADAEAGK